MAAWREIPLACAPHDVGDELSVPGVVLEQSAVHGHPVVDRAAICFELLGRALPREPAALP